MHRATGQYWANLAKTFSEQPILPLNASMLAHRFLNGYAKDLKSEIDFLSKHVPGMEKVQQQVTLLIRNVQEFVRRAAAFHSYNNNPYSSVSFLIVENNNISLS